MLEMIEQGDEPRTISPVRLFLVASGRASEWLRTLMRLSLPRWKPASYPKVITQRLDGLDGSSVIQQKALPESKFDVQVVYGWPFSPWTKNILHWSSVAASKYDVR